MEKHSRLNEIKDYIDDNVRKSTDSSIQALTIIIDGLKRDNAKHIENEIKSRQDFRVELADIVERQIKITVNGKIDKIDKKIDELTPVLRQYNENKIVEERDKKRGMFAVKLAGGLVTIGGALTLMKFYLNWFLK